MQTTASADIPTTNVVPIALTRASENASVSDS